jgi:hypothetical protein
MDFRVHKFNCNVAFSSNGHLLALGFRVDDNDDDIKMIRKIIL